MLIGSIAVVNFTDNDLLIKIPGIPRGRVKVLNYDLKPHEELSVRILSRRRVEVRPSLEPTFETLDGKKYPLEPRDVPSSPVVLRYGIYRGVKKATVLIFEITKENGKFYQNSDITLDITLTSKTSASVHTLPGTDSLDLAILTTRDLKPAFDSLAEFKNLTGMRTAVFTLDEALTYPGRTPAERIRNFIRYLYERWGVKFLLVGGDRFHIPSPVLHLPSFFPYDYGDVMRSDAYYGSLDGDWNSDGNWNFGELSDSLDLWMDVAVGRMPATDLDEAMDMVRRVIYYETHYNWPFPPKILLFASRFVADNDACTTVGNMASYIPPSLTHDSLCEMDAPERDVSMEEFVNSVNNSTFLMAFSHSNYRTFIVNIDTLTVPFLAQDVVRLSTDSTPVFWIHMGCLVNSPNTNSINALIYKAGKSIASYGASKESSPSVAVPMVGNGFRNAYSDTSGFFAGMVDLYSKHFAASVGYYFSYVYEAMSYNLIGDPSLRLYRSIPSTFSASVSLSSDTLVISGAPSGAIVSVLQGGRVLGRWKTDVAGSLRVRVVGASPGSLKVGVYAEGYLPYINSIPYGPSTPTFVYSYPDTLSSGDTLLITGKIYAPALDSVWVVFRGSPPLFSDSTYVGTVTDSQAFALRVPTSPFKGNEKLKGYLSLNCPACSGVGDSIFVVGRGPELSFLGGRLRGDILHLILLNSGNSSATSLRILFEGGDLPPTSITSPENIPPHSVDSATAIFPSLSSGVTLSFLITDIEGDTVRASIVIPSSLPVARELTAVPGDGYVRLMWRGSWDGTLIEVDTGDGWHVLSVAPGGWNTVEDRVVEWKVRCYRAVPMLGGVLGIPSHSVCNRPNPPTLFVKDLLFAGYRANILAADLLPSPGYEIVVPSLYNYISVYSSDGRLLWRYSVDTLPSLTEISASAVVGDVDGDGKYEVVFGTAGSPPSLIVLDENGNLKWKRPLPHPPTAPVVLGLFTNSYRPDIAVKAGPSVLFYDGFGNLINSCGPYAWADEYMSAADLYGDSRWELVLRGNSSGSVMVITDAYCSDTLLNLPSITYVGSRIFDYDGDGKWEVLFNASIGALIFDPNTWTFDTVPFSITPDADVTMPLEWDGSGGWEYARLNMYDFSVVDGDGSELLSHRDDIHPISRRFVAGDVDGDGREEVFFSSGRSVLWGKTYYGDLMGFPIDLGHGDRFREEVVQSGPLLYDLNGDGKVELCAHTSGHHLYCWSLGRFTRISWPMVRGNRWNSGFGSLEMPDTLVVNLAEGKEQNSEVSLTVSDGYLRVNGEYRERIIVKIYSVSGRMVLSKVVVGKGNVPLKDLPSGVYFAYAHFKSGMKNIKLIVK